MHEHLAISFHSPPRSTSHVGSTCMKCQRWNLAQSRVQVHWVGDSLDQGLMKHAQHAFITAPTWLTLLCCKCRRCRSPKPEDQRLARRYPAMTKQRQTVTHQMKRQRRVTSEWSNYRFKRKIYNTNTWQKHRPSRFILITWRLASTSQTRPFCRRMHCGADF